MPLFDTHDKPKQYVAIRSDITARKLAEEQLLEQASLARLGAMASVVAHEVRNPLAGVMGALQVLRGRMVAESEERMIVGDVLARIDQLNASLSDLLLYARPRAVHKAPTNVRLLLEEVAESTRADPRFAGVDVQVEGQDKVCTVDANLIGGAVLNLALNAAQAAEGKGRIQLVVADADPCCRLEVRDDGPGIDASVRARIFEPFFTTKPRGTGLGLPIVKRIVEQHGGTIGVDCPESGGTVVHLQFPLG